MSFEHFKCLELIENTFGKMNNNSSSIRTEQLASRKINTNLKKIRYHKAKYNNSCRRLQFSVVTWG